MCFLSSSGSKKINVVPDPVVVQDPVNRKKADAELTKNSNENSKSIRQNIKTSALGLNEEINTNKKTLLGE